MNRDNQPVFNANRKVANYKDFSADVEKEKLGKVRRSFQPNSDRQNFPSNDRNEFDPITRKITQVTLPEVEDKLKSLEETNEGVSDDISKLIKRKLDGKNLSQKDFLKLHNWMMENDEDYCKSVDKQMSKDLKKLVPKNTEIKNENKSFESNLDIPLKLRLAYQKWIESEQPDYFGGDRDQELRMKTFIKELDGHSSAETRSKFIKALDSQYGEIPKRFRSHFLR